MNSRTLAIAAVCLCLGMYFARPAPEPPRPDRPVLSVIARLAKLGLWIMLVGESAPAEKQTLAYHAHVDADGHRILEHGEGW
jgi:hypothetical protein